MRDKVKVLELPDVLIVGKKAYGVVVQDKLYEGHFRKGFCELVLIDLGEIDKKGKKK